MRAIFPDLKEKIILVTGATRGIGLEICKGLAEQNAHVVFSYREAKKELAEEIKSKLLKTGASDCTTICFDVTDVNSMKDVISNFQKEHGIISGLVNNAGISKDQLALRLKLQDVQDTINTNLIGPIMLSSILSRGFLSAKNPSIVNISSVVGLMGNASQVSYAASKSGLIGMTKSIAREFASKNIRCNAICPGYIKTDMTESLTDDAKNNLIEKIPLKKVASPEELTSLVNFLLSNASSYITGEVIKIDGGLYI